MSVLVTGATGFVGSAVVRALLAQGVTPRALVRPATDAGWLVEQGVDVVRGDLTRADTLAPALAGCKTLYHVAADYRLWHPQPALTYQVNVEGTGALMQAALAAGVDKIVYTSSVATLGIVPGGQPGDEQTPVSLDDMIGHYKRSKYLAERAVQRMVAEKGLPAVIVNPSTPIGPGDLKPTPTGRTILDAAAGRMPAYVDTGLNVVHVDDVATGHLLAARDGQIGRRYILGGTDMSLRSILTSVARLTDRRPPRLKLPRRGLFPLAYLAEMQARLTGSEPRLTLDSLRMAGKRMYFSSARASQELGYRPRPAHAALADAVRWFREHGYC